MMSSPTLWRHTASLDLMDMKTQFVTLALARRGKVTKILFSSFFSKGGNCSLSKKGTRAKPSDSWDGKCRLQNSPFRLLINISFFWRLSFPVFLRNIKSHTLWSYYFNSAACCLHESTMTTLMTICFDCLSRVEIFWKKWEVQQERLLTRETRMKIHLHLSACIWLISCSLLPSLGRVSPSLMMKFLTFFHFDRYL